LSDQNSTCLPTSAWFLFDENAQPLGQLYRPALPKAGLRVEGSDRFETGVVIDVTELRATCSMRRFRVVVRVLS
jgi:hypothetical protein